MAQIPHCWRFSPLTLFLVKFQSMKAKSQIKIKLWSTIRHEKPLILDIALWILNYALQCFTFQFVFNTPVNFGSYFSTVKMLRLFALLRFSRWFSSELFFYTKKIWITSTKTLWFILNNIFSRDWKI